MRPNESEKVWSAAAPATAAKMLTILPRAPRPRPLRPASVCTVRVAFIHVLSSPQHSCNFPLALPPHSLL
jgi:hypothetical protein